MKIDSKFIYPINFTTKSITSKRVKNLFEEYIKLALSEIEIKELSQKTQKERFNISILKIRRKFRVFRKVNE